MKYDLEESNSKPIIILSLSFFLIRVTRLTYCRVYMDIYMSHTIESNKHPYFFYLS